MMDKASYCWPVRPVWTVQPVRCSYRPGTYLPVGLVGLGLPITVNIRVYRVSAMVSVRV